MDAIMTITLTQDEVRRRAPVWVALSDLFLDTDVSLFNERNARILRESKFHPLEVERILREEVGSVFYDNLLDIAGEWSGWPSEFVEKEVRDFLANPSMARAAQTLLSAAVVGSVLKNDWQNLKTRAWGNE
jgi:hypothetical protein